MGNWSFAGSCAFVLTPALLSGAACAAGPDISAADKDTEFLIAACQNSINDLAVVGRLAKEQNWSSLIDPDLVEYKPVKIHGMWRVNRDGRTYTVTTGVDPKGITSCFVSFSEPRPQRDDFAASAAKALPLKSEGDGRGHAQGVQFETYRIENSSSAGSMLQIVSMDGLVLSAMIFGPFAETPPPPGK
jgi:hypothetical protein